MQTVTATDFASWRTQARTLLQAGFAPSSIQWNQAAAQTPLFAAQTLPAAVETLTAPTVLASAALRNTDAPTVPAAFLSLAETVCHHRDPQRFALLYEMLWRITHGEAHLLHVASNPLTRTLQLMEKAVTRDVHKTKAFVRFRQTTDEDGAPHYVAWHCPDHFSLRLSAPFFQRRFAVMRWTILTPDESVQWDGTSLHYGPGATAADAPGADATEALWKAFYRAVFNPARLKIKAMKKEMPVRHWATLPEAALIEELIREAPQRVTQMIVPKLTPKR